MNTFHIILLLSGFCTGFSLPMLPDAANRQASHTPIWSLAFSIGVYVLIMAVCAIQPNFVVMLACSLGSVLFGVIVAGMLKSERNQTAKLPEASLNATVHRAGI